MKIELNKEQKEKLEWVLFMFIDTHEDSGIYKEEIKVCVKVLKELKKS